MFVVLKNTRFYGNIRGRAARRQKSEATGISDILLEPRSDRLAEASNLGRQNSGHNVKQGKQKRDDTPQDAAQGHYIPITKVTKSDPIWSAYTKETQVLDKEMLEAWSNNMDVLLVFSALFSAILTAFLVEVHQNLKQSPADLTNEHLVTLIQRLDHIITNSSTLHPPTDENTFTASSRSIRVNFCWFTSLTCSLFAAGGAMLAKQWFREYSRGSTGGSYYDQCQLRQRRFDGLQTWRFQEVVELLPTLMHIALFLFFVGLIDFLWELYRPISIFLISFFSFTIFTVFVTNMASIYTASCPYRTPITKHAGRLFKVVVSKILTISSAHQKPGLESVTQSCPKISIHRRKHETRTSDGMEPLLWLLENSTNQGTALNLLKLAPAFLTTLPRRTKLIHTGVADQLTRLIASQGEEQPDIKIDPDEVSYYTALLSILLTPIPPSSTGRDDIPSWLNILAQQNSTDENQEEANDVLLAMSLAFSVNDFAPLYSIANQVVRRQKTALWARVIFLNAVSKSASKSDDQTFILEVVLELADSTPPHHVTRQFLATLFVALIAIFGGDLSLDDYTLHNRMSVAELGSLSYRCLESMARTARAQKEVSTSSQGFVSIVQTDLAIAITWRMFKALGCEKELSWNILVDKLIAYSLTSRGLLSGPALDVVLEFRDRYSGAAIEVLVGIPMEQRIGLLKACLVSPDAFSSNETHARISCASVVIAGNHAPNNPSAALFQALLADVDKIYNLIAWSSIDYAVSGWKEARLGGSFRLISAVCGVENVPPGSHKYQHVDHLVERGLIVDFLKLLQLAGAPGTEVTWWAWESARGLAHCAKAKWFTAKNSSLKELAVIATNDRCRKRLLVEGWTVVTIFLTWSTALVTCQDDEREGLLLEFVGAGILNPLSRLVEWMDLVSPSSYPGLHQECFDVLVKFIDECTALLQRPRDNIRDAVLKCYGEFLQGLLAGINQQGSSSGITGLAARRREELRRLAVGQLSVVLECTARDREGRPDIYDDAGSLQE